MYGALVASVGAVVLMLAADETFAGSQAAPRATVRATHSVFRSSLAHSLRHHHRRGDAGIVWPGDGFYDDGPSIGEPLAGAPQPESGDIHYTYKYDVPWDWAHRYPPSVTSSGRPYVSSCPAESVTVPGRDGKDQTVSITRCY